MDATQTEAYIALIGTLFGGAGMKIVEAILGRHRNRDNTAASIRTELRTDLSAVKIENTHLHQEIDRLEDEVDHWRDKYYKLVAENAKRGIIE